MPLPRPISRSERGFVVTPRRHSTGHPRGIQMHLDPTTPVLNSLMEAAHTEHLAIISAGKDSVARAMNAGDRLLEIIERKLIHRGQRRTLFKQVCGSTRTGEIYVQLAKARALIEGNAQSSALFSIDAALKFLRQHN